MYPSAGGPRWRRRGFPRTRGDVPILAQATLTAGWLPPHTRGCTRFGPAVSKRRYASPAHAGMYRAHGSVATTGRGFPRTRGDVPRDQHRCTSCGRLPPHTRGCTSESGATRLRTGASPAHAGMYPTSSPAPTTRRRFPRTRGDVPDGRDDRQADRRLPPHTRGCTARAGRAVRNPGASPAHAGMYRTPSCSIRGPMSFPRTRGDVPLYAELAATGELLPPHTRGCTTVQVIPHVTDAASPAHAGMYPAPSTPRPSSAGFPRTRGDVPVLGAKTATGASLPPHTRGCTLADGVAEVLPRASPAHAGMYPFRGPSSTGRACFPRTRGDVPPTQRLALATRLLPPHTRGCTEAAAARATRDDASPAHAGMYRTHTPRRRSRACFPRTRGDVPCSPSSPPGRDPLPPHTRGCTHWQLVHAALHRASPAHAGMYR